jgi:hypothetical protein
LDSSFKEALQERNVAVNKRIDDVNERITKLDERLQIEKSEILQQIDDQGIALNKLLVEFKVQHSVNAIKLTMLSLHNFRSTSM